MDDWRQLALGGAILVETQEKRLAACLRAHSDTVQVVRLTPQPSADCVFAVNGTVIGVERKAASDLLGSWIGATQKCVDDCEDCKGKGCPHLGSQLQRMRRSVDHVVLVVEGWFGRTESGYIETAHRKHQLRWDGLWNALSKWQARGVELQLTADVPHTAERIVSLRSYMQRRNK